MHWQLENKHKTQRKPPHNVLPLEDLNEKAATQTVFLMRCLHRVIFLSILFPGLTIGLSLGKGDILQDITLS